MKFITPTILILLAIGAFFGYIDPKYDDVKILRDREKLYNEALDRSRDLIEIRDLLLAKYNTFSSSDLERLEKLLPDNVDNVRLILDIDNIAARYGMSLQDVSISGEAAGEKAETVETNNKPYESIILDFTVNSSYENFMQFIADLESSLRVVDLVSLTFRAGDTDFNQYDVGIKTYWLR